MQGWTRGRASGLVRALARPSEERGTEASAAVPIESAFLRLLEASADGGQDACCNAQSGSKGLISCSNGEKMGRQGRDY
jgi:hypothetical protein